MKVERRFTKGNSDPYAGLDWEVRTSEIRNPDGTVVFSNENVVVPSGWSQIATDIIAHKYFRKTGVPQSDGSSGGENDARQVFHRLAHTWTEWGKKVGYFTKEEDSSAFYDEMRYMLARQMGAPNSPQWFNTGLYDVYGITGPPQGHYYVDHKSGKLMKAKSAYERPQPHACFILNIEDNLVNEDGILNLITREARLFKYGSGTGSNFSKLRGEGEPLSGGGVSSGLLSFLKTADRSAAAIKSGGTTRRAAKMVILDVDHPDIEKYIAWKEDEEHKVASMVAGSAMLARYAKQIVESVEQPGEGGTAAAGLEVRANPLKNQKLSRVVANAARDGVPGQWLYQIVKMVAEGEDPGAIRKFTVDWQDEAYNTISGQSSNNSVRVSDEFMRAVLDGTDWELIGRTDGKVRGKVEAKGLWHKIAQAAWKCADPGIQFHTTVNDWHTCPEDGEIRGSNPCSEYMFLDDTACNLASLNLLKFYDEDSGRFRVEDYQHAIQLWTTVLEISVAMAQFPSENIAWKSHQFRTLGLGYANLGTLLMVMGIPYDSAEARAIAGALTSILSGEGYAQSARLAEEAGAFPRYEANRDHMLRVIRNHRRAAYNVPKDEYDGLSVYPMGIDERNCPDYLLTTARESWDRAVELGEKHGFRNAQVTAIAPTGTIGLVMDCDTTGVEPDFALVKFKKLAGGGYFKIINRSIPPALKKLGYSKTEIEGIVRYCVG
ncbi:MAG TPA: adenosylcobalamin-dependent ribonucleoside-diphosphate reductase, partial [Spirochaetia bacterium]|nr:adenosylcobalamin-dependent ribonucleoside-diphosphate reductase [Spirochaetia bacterium]